MDFKRNYAIMKEIPARKKAAFMEKAKTLPKKSDIFSLAKKTAIFYGKKNHWNVEEIKTAILSLYACGLAVWHMEKAVSVFDYLTSYIAWKAITFDKMNDYGAFGDAIETVIHLIATRKVWRANKKVLHVSEIGKVDVVINGIPFEVGHNGKTWNDSTVDDAMHGNFVGVIYGVISEEERKAIINLFSIGKIMEGIKTIASMLYVFPDKYDFLAFIDSISRTKTIQYKDHLGKYQTIYNGSKASAFIRKVEESNYQTLREYMLTLSDNEYVK